MAVAVKPSNSLFNIRSGIKSIKNSFSGLRKNAGNLNDVMLKKTKVKRESIARNYILSQRRKENERRKDKEDLLEASSIGGVFKAKAVASSTKGFLGRIMDFLATLLVGWLLTNLPSIITMAQELIARIQRLYTIVTGFFDNTIKLFRGFGNLLSAVSKNILTFDFTDSKGRVESALTDLGGTFEDMQSQFDEGFKLLTTSLGEGVVSGEDAQPFGTQYENESMQQQPSGGGLPNDQSPEMYRIAAALSTEGSGAQSTVDMMQVVVNRKASGKYGSSYTEILSRPNQFEGVEKKGVGGFKKIQTLQDASKWSGQSEATLLGIIKNIQDPSLQASSAKYVGGALEFRAAPGYYTANNGAKLIKGQMGPDGRFYGSGWRGGPGDNQFLKDPVRDKSRINPAGPASFNNLPNPILSPSTAKGITTAVRDEINVAGPSGGTPSVGLSREAGSQYFARRSGGRRHAGIDIGTSGSRGYYVSFRQSGKVTYARNNGEGYGNLVIIKSGNTEFYFAHLARIMVKEGQAYNGETIGEIGKTGGNYPIHLHFEARPNGNPINPKPYLGLLSIGKQLTGLAGQPAQIAIPTPAQITPSGTQQRQQASQQLAQQQSGPSIIIIEEEPPAQQSQGSIGGGEAMMIPIVINPLNSFITKKLLLDLAYT
jgi:murein DD-endopeptidase MepM/ murein hydrolase activator NlpD